MDLHQVLLAYRSFNPAGWVSVYRAMPTWVGILCVGLGITLLLFGGGRFFRLVAGPAGALVGYLWAPIVTLRFGLNLDPDAVATVAAAGLGVAGVSLPASTIFFGVGLPAGFAAGNLAGESDWLLGFFPGFIACGTLAAVFTRHIAAVFSAALGGWILVLGMLSALHRAGGLVAAVASQPYGVLLAAALFAVAGAIFQLFVRPSPEEAARLRVEKMKAKRRAAEKRELDKRWSAYGASKDD
jgi:hypothetical protein